MGTYSTSDYPNALPARPPVLEDGFDWVTTEALALAHSHIEAIESTIGLDPQVVAGKDFGSLGSLFRALWRIENGNHVPSDEEDFRVDFTAGRFKVAPIVLVTLRTTSEPGNRRKVAALDVSEKGFTLGSGVGPTTAIGDSFDWIAIGPLFPIEDHTDE